MKVVHETDLVTLYEGDARDVLPTLGKESVDLVVTDPPYGQNFQSKRRRESFDRIEGDATSGDAVDLLTAVTPELVRVTRRTRHLYTFGLPLEHELLAAKGELIWDKVALGSGDLSLPWATSHERIFFHARAYNRANVKAGAGRLAARLRRGSVIRARRATGAGVTRHPTEKPVDLLRQIIESSSTLGEVVLDPFAGSGSTLVAALVEGRRAIGVEKDGRYASVARGRVREVESFLSRMVKA